jgi:hypothetical protein
MIYRRRTAAVQKQVMRTNVLAMSRLAYSCAQRGKAAILPPPVPIHLIAIPGSQLCPAGYM